MSRRYFEMFDVLTSVSS